VRSASTTAPALCQGWETPRSGPPRPASPRWRQQARPASPAGQSTRWRWWARGATSTAGAGAPLAATTVLVLARIRRPGIHRAPCTAGSLIRGSHLGCVSCQKNGRLRCWAPRTALTFMSCLGNRALCTTTLPVRPRPEQDAVPCRGDFGRLGHGDCSDVFLPRQISAFSGIRVVRIAGGDTHSLVVCLPHAAAQSFPARTEPTLQCNPTGLAQSMTPGCRWLRAPAVFPTGVGHRRAVHVRQERERPARQRQHGRQPQPSPRHGAPGVPRRCHPQVIIDVARLGLDKGSSRPTRHPMSTL